MTLGAETAARVAVVCGAAGDVGRAVVARFRADGWRVVGLARAGSDAPVGVGVDLAEADAVTRAADAICAEAVPACVVQCAGSYRRSDDALDAAMLRANVGVAQSVLAAFAPRMRDSANARIITVGSIDAVVPNPNSVAYSVAKAAVHQLVAVYRKMYKDTALSIDLIVPGAIAGRMRQDKRESKEALVQPDDVARMCAAIAGIDGRIALDDVVMVPKSFTYGRS